VLFRSLAYYRRKREEYLSCVKMLEQYLDRPAVTKDGRRIEIGLNIGSREEDMDSRRKYVDMVGLFRTEFMYMNSDYLPTEEQQFEAYMKILITFGKKPVILRTLDIGGDKALPCLALPKEENPFLGKRALRLCFDRPELFKTQLRAALRASIYGNLWIMFPMVGSMDDLRRAKKILEEVKQELAEEKIAFSKEVKAGIMIEIPSIAIMAEKAAKEVDFASIGTNDLCQYLLAADRINPEVAGYYQSYHPALFSLIGHVAAEFHKAGKPICICGELGGDELAVPVLVGLGMDRLSMNFSSVAKIKKLLSEMTIQQMQAYAQAVTGMDTAAEAEEYLRKVLQCS
jgi:phosphotransferase system enzyme I (PtsI)